METGIKKKILFFVPAFPVMSETFIERELCELKKRGNIDVQIVALEKGSELNCPELSGSVSYIKLSYKDILNGIATFITKNPKGLWQTSVLINGNKSRNYFSNQYLWLKSVGYAHLFSKAKFDHVHVHFLSEPSTIALIAATLLNKPLSISGHARDVFGGNGGPELIPEKARYAKFIALCNKKAYVHCVNLAGTKDKTKPYLMPHGVDITNFEPSQKNQVFSIYFVGRFVEKKGLTYLLEAAKILKDRGEVFSLNIAGYGPLYNDLKTLAEKLNINVNFLNEGAGVDNNQALQQMAHADLFVVPSVDLSDGDSDGIPNNILEAGVFSKPVVTTDAGSILEVIKNNETGLVARQKDAQSLADAISQIMHYEGLAQKLGRNLNVFVKENFDIKKNIIELEQLLIK